MALPNATKKKLLDGSIDLANQSTSQDEADDEPIYRGKGGS